MADKNNLTTLVKRLRPLIKFAAQEVVGASNGVRLTILTFPGTLSVSDNPLRIYNQLGISQTITEIFLTVGTAPTGANLIVDVHKNGTTIFTTQANRPVIMAGANTGNSIMIDVPEWADGEYLTAHIDQIGSTIKGADLVVHIVHQGGGGIGDALANHDHSGDAGDGGTFDAANLTAGASGDGTVLTSDGAGGAAFEAIPAKDAADVTYTPAVNTDWDGDADPGNVDDALDQLAERTDDLEGAALANHDHSGDAGDGGTFDAANLTAGASTDGQVLTSDGAGGAAWEDPAGGALADHDHSGNAGDGGTFDAANLTAGASTDGQVLTSDGAGNTAWEDPPAGGVVDASDVTYTPAVAADWDGDADPGNADDAFDQLAERVDDLEAAGGGGINWELVVDEDGSSIANWTSVSGTWATDGSVIKQTNNAGASRLKYNNKVIQVPMIMEVEVMFPSAGQSTSANMAGGMLSGWDGAGSGSNCGRLHMNNKTADFIQIERDSVTAVNSLAGVWGILDTWYTLMIISGIFLTIYLDGTIKVTGGNMGGLYNANYIGLFVQDATVHFRNFKVWNLTIP